MGDFGFLGFDLWQVKAGTIFDNVIVTDDKSEADAFAKKWKDLSEVENAKKKEEDDSKKAADDKKDEKDEDDDDEDDEEKKESASSLYCGLVHPVLCIRVSPWYWPFQQDGMQ